MTPPAEAAKHSYERFAQMPAIQETNRALITRAPRVHTATDLGTGTGAIIEILFEQGKLADPFHVFGVDIDKTGLAIAKRGFKSFGDKVEFIHARAEHIPGIPDSSQQLVTICGAIHLTDAPQTMAEAARILVPGGTLLVSTAYERTNANPQGATRMLGVWVGYARRLLEKQGFTEFGPPANRYRYSEADFRKMAQDTGFHDIEITTHPIHLDSVAIKAIGNYWEFAEGVFPGIPIESSTTALVETVEPMLERFKTDHIPRNFMFLTAQKPTSRVP